MRKVEDYKRHADECRLLAAGATNDDTRRQLLDMVETWESLARDRAAQIDRKKRIAAWETGSGN